MSETVLSVSAPKTVSKGSQKKAIVAGVSGNILEWYDFGIYGFMAAIIAQHFFPSTDESAALLATFGAFGVGFVARPIGSLVLGRLADTVGRKNVLTFTILLMAVSTVMIGLLPSYASIGLWAPILLVVARFAQGFSAGGEWGSVSAFLVEWAGPNRRGFLGSFQQASIAFGLLLAAAVSALLSSVMPAEALQEWGWRIPFLIGGILGPIGMYMRRNIDEPPVFKVGTAADNKIEWPSLLGKIFHCFSVALFWTVSAYLVTVYMSTYVQKFAGYGRAEALWGSTLSLAVFGLFSPVAGAISDKIGRKPLLIASCCFFIAFSYPLYGLILTGGGLGKLLAIQCGMALLFTVYAGVGPVVVSEMFDTSVRATGSSVGASLASIFGGFSPMIVIWCIDKTGTPVAASYVLIGSAVFTLIGVLFLKDRFREPL